MSTFCPTYCDAQIYRKMVGLLCLLLCKSFFSQQRVLHIKPKIPLIVYHTDQGDEDVDVIELGHQGQMSGTREGHWATSDLQPEKLIRPVASVSTSVPHGSADPVHFPNQIPARQCNWLIHRIYQPPPTAPKNNPPLVFNYPSHIPWVKMSIVQLHIWALSTKFIMWILHSCLFFSQFVCWIACKALYNGFLAEQQCVCGGIQSIFLCIT